MNCEHDPLGDGDGLPMSLTERKFHRDKDGAFTGNMFSIGACSKCGAPIVLIEDIGIRISVYRGGCLAGERK